MGLAASKRLAEALTAAIARGTPIGAGGSRLLRGNAPPSTRRSRPPPRRSSAAERTLFFGSGYVANFALFSTLPQRDDLLVIDELVHASAREGAPRRPRALCRGAPQRCGSLRGRHPRLARGGGRGHVWIAVESLYSMDGDRAPLDDLGAIAERHDAFLVVDEAHATGVFGPEGAGWRRRWRAAENVIAVHTCSKALGSAGALVTLPRVLCDFLVNRCRPFIFATAPSPLMAVASLESLAILKDEPERRHRLARLDLVARAHASKSKRGAPDPARRFIPSSSATIAPTIAPPPASQSADSMSAASGRRPCRTGTARLRISITLNVDERAIAELFDGLARRSRRRTARHDARIVVTGTDTDIGKTVFCRRAHPLARGHLLEARASRP